MSTRQAFSPQLHLMTLGERPRLFVDCGFGQWSFWFDDCDELLKSMETAVQYRNMPEYAAAAGLEYVRTMFGHYDSDSFGDDPAEPAVCTEAPSPEPANLITPHGRQSVQELFVPPGVWRSWREATAVIGLGVAIEAVVVVFAYWVAT